MPGDNLDEALSQLDALDQERQQRRVPAPQTRSAPPANSPASGRPAPVSPPSRGGTSFFDSFRDAAGRALDSVLPGTGTALGLATSHPQETRAIGAGFLRALPKVAAGAADFAADAISTQAASVGKRAGFTEAQQKAAGSRADPRNYQGDITPSGIAYRYAPTQDTYSGFERQIDPLAHVGPEAWNETSANVSALAVGYGLGGALLKGVGVAPKIEEAVQAIQSPWLRAGVSTAARVTGFGAVDAMLMDPEQERFSNMLQRLGVHNEFVDYLAHHDQEGHMEGRWKNAVEGVVAGTAAESLFAVGKFWRARLRGDHATADAVQEELAAKHDGQVPDYITEEHPGLPPAPEGEPGFVGGWETAPEGHLRPVYEEDPLAAPKPAQAAEAEADGAIPPKEGEAPAEPVGSTGASVAPMDPKVIAAAMGDPAAGGAHAAPIVAMRHEAASIESSLPPVPDGHVRLWRGERPGEDGLGLNYTTDLPGIALPFQKQYKGRLSYIDVPEADLPKYGMGAGATDAEFHLPAKLAKQSQEAQSPVVTFTAQRTPTDAPFVVGSMERDALTGLSNDVRFWRAARDETPGDTRIGDVTREAAPETTARVGEFRLGVIGSQANTAPLLRALVDRLPEDARKPVSTAELMKDALRAANDVGTDPATMLEAARLISGKLGDADVAMATLRTVWKRAADDLDEINLPGVDWATADEATVEDAGRRIHNMLAISSHVQTAKSGLGRGLRVNQLPDADSYLATLRKAEHGDPTIMPEGETAPPLPRTRQEVKDWFDLWGTTKGDPELRDALLEGTLTRFIPSGGRYLRAAFPNFFTASILSMPKTLLLNLIGPAFMSVVRNMERLAGASLEGVNPLLSASERATMRTVARQTVPAYLQTFMDISDGMRWAYKAAEENKTLIGGAGSIDAQARLGPFTDNLIRATGQEPNWTYSLGNWINAWPRVVARINNGFDEFSKRLAYYGEVRVKAMVEGSEQGLGGEDLRAFVKEKLRGSTNELGHAVDESALREAERTTLTAQVGEPGGTLRGFSNWVQHVRRDIPEVRYLLPIFNVPANTLGETLRRLPIAQMPGLNRVLFKRTADELAGNYGPVIQADARGRLMTGTSFLMAGIMLNRAGLMTGAGPQNPTDRKVWLTEHQPYSIRVGDEWVRYDKYDVLGSLLSIPATIVDATQNVRQDQAVGDMVMSGAGALAQWFKDRAALRTAAGWLSVGQDPTANMASTVGSTAGSVLQGFVPAAIQGTVTNVIDPIQRSKRDWEDYLKAAIPGLSTQLPPVRNVLGEPINRPADTFAEAIFPVVIAPAVTFKDDPVIDELDRLYQSTGYGAGADPKALGNGFFNPKDVKLENGQSLYDAFMQSRLTLKVQGRTLRQSLNALFASNAYNQAVDADSGAKLTSRGDTSRGYLVQQTFAIYNKAIKAEIAEASPTANRWLTASAAKLRDDAYLKDVTAEDLANNSNLYATHGIDGGAYSAEVRRGSTGALVQALSKR